jgi:hypothetical protein
VWLKIRKYRFGLDRIIRVIPCGGGWVRGGFCPILSLTKHQESSRSYGKGGSRGDRHDDDRDEGRRRDDLSRMDPEPLPLPPPTNDHREEGGYQEP